MLVNAHPDFDIEYDEWEYLTDEYWDGEPDRAARPQASDGSTTQSSGKRKREHHDVPAKDGTHKRRKCTPKPEHSFHHSAVVWKNKDNENELDVPILRSEEGVKIAILQNWRELLNQPAREAQEPSVSESQETKGTVHNKPKKKSAALPGHAKRDGTAADTDKVATQEKDKIISRATRTSKRLKN